MKKSRLSRAACAAALVILSNTAHAALVNQILGLDIDGTLYDVTFHTTTGDTFMALWDADNDGVFGGGTSVFDTAPTFWGDLAGATSAAAAIVLALGDVDTTTTRPSDSFFIPHAVQLTDTYNTILTAGIDNIRGTLDWQIAVDTKQPGVGQIAETYDPAAVGTYPYATFEVSAVPVPAAVWLFGSGLLGLVGVARRKKA